LTEIKKQIFMKITITGSLGNISRRIVEILAAKGHEVTVVSHTTERKKDIEALHAKAAIGSVENPGFLAKAFDGADAVYTMVPPDFNTPDYKEFTLRVSRNYAKAIVQAGVRHVVNLSSVGSPVAGIKPLTEYCNMEENLDQLEGVHVLHLRPGMFYTNFYGSIGMIRQMGVIGNNFDETVNMVMTHPADIAEAASEALDKLSFSGKQVKYIVSDEKNGKQLTQILAEALGRPDLRWMHFTDEQLLGGLMQNGFSKHVAENYLVAMGVAIREGLLEKHYRKNQHEVFGKTGFGDFAKEFAYVYHNS
jgi:uncharacterized protein YbjT (DUF2867 family)